MEAPRPKDITFNQFANTYVPFGILVTLALLLPEQTQNPDLYRTFLTIWVTTILLIPAICLFIFLGVSRVVGIYWLLLWSFSLLSFLIHFYYGTFVQLKGFADTFAQQGVLIATTNFLLTFWWTVDVILAWTLATLYHWVWVQRAALHIFIFAIFLVTNLFLRGDNIRILGIIFTVVIVLCVVIRLYIVSGRISQTT